MPRPALRPRPPAATTAHGPRVAVIGAGLGGVAAAIHARRLGLPVTVFERSPGPGGTWWDNRYPGAACDIPSHYYSYSFRLHEWPRTHATQAEIQDYVEQVVDEHGLRPHLRFGVEVERAEWDEARSLYVLTTTAGATHEAEVLVTATGLLNHPRYPMWPGMAEFAGPMFHTARWEHEHDLAGKHVAIVGTGSTAAQVVPALAGHAGRVTLFSREPAWVVPKNDHDFSERQMARLRLPGVRRFERLKVLLRTERTALAADPESGYRQKMERTCREYFDATFADRPDLAEVLRPDYPFYCKRPLISSDFYPALKRDDVTLVPRGVQRVTRDGLVDTDGTEHPADVVVLATGFEPWRFLPSVEVVGRAGRSIHGVWGDEPEAFLGLNVTGFPNHFILYGPNSNVGCVTAVLERQCEYVGRALARMVRTGAATIDVPRPVMDATNRIVDRGNGTRAWDTAGCNNYFHAPSGRNVTQWPWTQMSYTLATKVGHRFLRTAGTFAAPPADDGAPDAPAATDFASAAVV